MCKPYKPCSEHVRRYTLFGPLPEWVTPPPRWDVGKDGCMSRPLETCSKFRDRPEKDITEHGLLIYFIWRDSQKNLYLLAKWLKPFWLRVCIVHSPLQTKRTNGFERSPCLRPSLKPSLLLWSNLLQHNHKFARLWVKDCRRCFPLACARLLLRQGRLKYSGHGCTPPKYAANRMFS